LAANSELLQLLNENRVLYNISKIDEEYILFVTAGPVVRVAVVTRLVHAQREMLISTVILLCVFAVATYMLALLLVKFSLKPVNKLVEYVDALDIHRLDVPVPLSGPANDEIRKIAQTLQNTLHLLKEQTDSLKDFVSHASHELKTPLMSLSSAVDVAQKT
jgi:signal transduction histidine kinase